MSDAAVKTTDDSPVPGMVARRSWPLWVFVATCLLLNIALLPIVKWLDAGSYDDEIFMLLCGAGILCGECCFVVVLSTLVRRTWFGGFLLGLSLAVLGYYAFVIGIWLIDEFESEFFAGAGVAPALLLVAASPLYLLRQTFGWRLAWEQDKIPPHQSFGLSDMFSLIAVCAAAFVLCRAPQIVWEEDADDYWWPLAIASVIIFGVGLIVPPTCTRIGLGIRSRAGTVFGLLLAGCGIVVTGLGILMCFQDWDDGWDERVELISYAAGPLVFAVGIFFASLVALRLCGLQLYRQKRVKGELREDVQDEAARRRRDTRWRIAAAIAVTTAVSGYLAHLQSWRIAKDAENGRLRELAYATGGGISFRDRYVRNLTLGEEATDEDFAQFRDCYRVEYLHLQSSRITDVSMVNLQRFRHLKSLALHRVGITDDSLIHLQHLRKLSSLNIENVDVRCDGIIHLPNKNQLQSLRLGGTQFGNEQCKLLRQFPTVTSLFLDGTQVTDGALRHIAAMPELTYLRLAGTRVTGEGVPLFARLTNLTLDETQVTDASVKSLVKLPKLNNLSLRATKITNAAIASLVRIPSLSELDVSRTSIDDEGLAGLRHSPTLVSLTLEHTNITGEGFQHWKPRQMRSLSLDHTAIDDTHIKHVAKHAPFRELSLSHTAVSDAFLPTLSLLTIKRLYVDNTQMTAQGILNSKLPSVTQLTLSDKQLPTSQRYTYQQKLGIRVSVRETPVEGPD